MESTSALLVLGVITCLILFVFAEKKFLSSEGQNSKLETKYNIGHSSYFLKRTSVVQPALFLAGSYLFTH